MQLIGSGESRGKEREREEKWREKEEYVQSPEPSGIPGLWKNCALVVFSSSSREHGFQEAQGLSTHSLALTSHLWLA